MNDRISNNPGRYKLVFEGNLGTQHAVLSLDDNPINPGTVLNTETLLSNVATTELGLDAEAIPSDAFVKLNKKIDATSDYTVLWSGAYYMMDSHVIALTGEKALSNQKHGYVFAWCWFENGQPKENKWIYIFVPKSHVQAKTPGIYMTDAYAGMNKYVYVRDTEVKGYTSNNIAGTENGIAYNNKNYVLRHIIGI